MFLQGCRRFAAAVVIRRYRGMSSDPENMTRVFLRRIDAKIDALGLDVRELKERVTGVEPGQTSIRRCLGALAETDARLQASFARMREDVTRVQRRLDLYEEPTT